MQAWENGMGDIGMIKGGLACLSGKEGVVNSVVELDSNSVGLVVYRREQEEQTINIMQTDATQMHDGGNTQG